MDEADRPAVEGRQLGGGLLRGGEIAVDPCCGREALDGHAVGAQQGEDAGLQGVQRHPRGVAGEQDLAVVERHRRHAPGRFAPGAVELVRQVLHQLGAEVGVLLAASLRVGAHQQAYAAGLRAHQAEGIAGPGRVRPAVGVEQVEVQRLGPRLQAVSHGSVGEHDQRALGSRRAHGGEEGVGRGRVEEERGERVDGGGEPPFHVGVEAHVHRRGLALGGAARYGSPGALHRLGGLEVETAYLIELEEQRIAQAGGRRGIEGVRKVRQNAFTEALLRRELLGIDELEGEEGQHVVVAPRSTAGKGAAAFAGARREIVTRLPGKVPIVRRERLAERRQHRAQAARLPRQSRGELRRRGAGHEGAGGVGGRGS